MPRSFPGKMSRYFGAVAALILVTVTFAARVRSDTHREFELRLERSVFLPGLLTSSSIVVAEDETIFAVDRKAATIYVYSADGALVDSIGRPGNGPGELRSPRSLAVNDSLVVTGNAGGAFTLFRRDGRTRNSFVAQSLRHQSSKILFVGGKLMIGGFQDEGPNPRGDMIHLFDVEGNRQASLFPLSGLEVEATGPRIVGVSMCDAGSGSFGAVQASEYRLIRFAKDLSAVEDSIILRPEYFRPRVSWDASGSGGAPPIPDFDLINGLFCLPDGLLGVQVMTPRFLLSPLMHLDIIDPVGKRLVATITTDSLSFEGMDSKQRLIRKEPAVDDEYGTTLEYYRLIQR